MPFGTQNQYLHHLSGSSVSSLSWLGWDHDSCGHSEVWAGISSLNILISDLPLSCLLTDGGVAIEIQVPHDPGSRVCFGPLLMKQDFLREVVTGWVTRGGRGCPRSKPSVCPRRSTVCWSWAHRACGSWCRARSTPSSFMWR